MSIFLYLYLYKYKEIKILSHPKFSSVKSQRRALINFLGDLLAKTFINDAPFLTSGIVGMEYLALLLGTIFVLSIFLLFTICFKNKYKIKNDD